MMQKPSRTPRSETVDAGRPARGRRITVGAGCAAAADPDPTEPAGAAHRVSDVPDAPRRGEAEDRRPAPGRAAHDDRSCGIGWRSRRRPGPASCGRLPASAYSASSTAGGFNSIRPPITSARTTKARCGSSPRFLARSGCGSRGGRCSRASGRARPPSTGSTARARSTGSRNILTQLVCSTPGSPSRRARRSLPSPPPSISARCGGWWMSAAVMERCWRRCCASVRRRAACSSICRPSSMPRNPGSTRRWQRARSSSAATSSRRFPRAPTSTS